MKIALCLYGNLRTYNKCYRSLYKRIIEKYDTDIFIHTWNTLDNKSSAWHNYKCDSENVLDNTFLESLYKIYGATSIEMENQVLEDLGYVNTTSRRISKFALKCMVHSMAEVNRLRYEYQCKYNIEYDYIVFTRPDILFYHDLELEKYIDKTSENCFYTAGSINNSIRLNDLRRFGATDVLFYATPTVIDHVFTDEEYIYNNLCNIETTQFGQEYSFIDAVSKLGHQVMLVNFLYDRDFIICRPLPDNLKEKCLFIWKKYYNLLKMHIIRP